MRSVWLNLGLVVLATVSCRYPPLPDLLDGGSDNGGGNSDGATSDAGPLPLNLELLAGNIGGPGNLDGTGAAARFHDPAGLAVDSAGNVYVADTANHTIRKITAAGVVTTLAGTVGVSGSVDGTGAAARFNNPWNVAVDSAGTVYVGDWLNHTIRKITTAGVVTTLAGTAGMSGSADGTGAAARFNQPQGVAADSAGNVYVADTTNHTIRKITGAGVVTTLAGIAGMSGSADGTGAAARFSFPYDVAVDVAGDVYVADTFNATIRKITATGVVTTLAGIAGMTGSADGTGAAARFNGPGGVAVDSANNVYVSDWYTIRKVTAAGVVTTLAGIAGMTGSADGTGAAARFNGPGGVAVDSASNIYVPDFLSNTIRKVTATGVVTTLAGTAGVSGSEDGTGAAVHFSGPGGVVVDSAGNVYVADTGNHTIRKVTATGVATTLAGTAGMSGSTDGLGAAARFNYPFDVAVDNAGNVYVADEFNAAIRKVTTAGGVTTLTGTVGSPTGVSIDSAGNIYVADNSYHIIRKVTTAGVVTTLAGTAGMRGSADGPGAAARFNGPQGVAVGSAGDVYVADTGNHTIRKITAAGVVTTLAGVAGMIGGADGTGAARFNGPSSVVVNSTGNVYVADTGNHTIRKVTAAGATTTIAGMADAAGIVLGATPRFAFPARLTTSGDSIVICDSNAILLLRHGAQ